MGARSNLSDIATLASSGTRPSYPKPAGSFRRAVHRWLTEAAARVRPGGTDSLLDRLKPDGQIPPLIFDVAVALLRSGRADAAYAVIERGARAYPEDLTLVQAAASLARHSSRFDSAVAHWHAAAFSLPDDPRTAFGLSAILRANFQPALASTIIDPACDRFPGNIDILAEAARVAMLRGRYDRALDLWSDVIARGMTSPEALKGKIEALGARGKTTEMQSAVDSARSLFPGDDFSREDGALAWRPGSEPDIAADQAEAEGSAREILISPSDLMMEFESLGDNCEFGLAQRYCGADPLGLFRFTESQASHLNHAFATRFEEYGVGDDLILEMNDVDKEYRGKSRRYDGFVYHTDTFGPGVDEAALHKAELRKLAYLKQRMLFDLRSGEKIFVRKQGHKPNAMELSQTIRSLGPNIFLWVEPADEDHPVGHVEIVEPGLFRGRISKFAWYGNAHALELDDWLKLCANALALKTGLGGDEVRYRIPENEVLQTGLGWDIGPRCLSQRTEAIRFDDRPVEKITLPQDTIRYDAIIARQDIETIVAPGSHIVFAVWIFVPSSFRGSVIDVYFINSPTCFLKVADLEKRDVWQRIYTSTRVPKDQRQAIMGLRVTGCADDHLYLATWRLEQGCTPNPWPGDVETSPDSVSFKQSRRDRRLLGQTSVGSDPGLARCAPD